MELEGFSRATRRLQPTRRRAAHCRCAGADGTVVPQRPVSPAYVRDDRPRRSRGARRHRACGRRSVITTSHPESDIERRGWSRSSKRAHVADDDRLDEAIAALSSSGLRARLDRHVSRATRGRSPRCLSAAAAAMPDHGALRAAAIDELERDRRRRLPARQQASATLQLISVGAGGRVAVGVLTRCRPAGCRTRCSRKS